MSHSLRNSSHTSISDTKQSETPRNIFKKGAFREHQQQAVVDLDGPVDLLDEFLAPLHVFRSEPDPQLFATHLLVQPPSELGTCGIHCVRLLS